MVKNNETFLDGLIIILFVFLFCIFIALIMNAYQTGIFIQKYHEECWQSVQLEKFRMVENDECITNCLAPTYDCQKINDYHTDCVRNNNCITQCKYDNNQTFPFIEQYNETQCTKFILVRNV